MITEHGEQTTDDEREKADKDEAVKRMGICAKHRDAGKDDGYGSERKENHSEKHRGKEDVLAGC